MQAEQRFRDTSSIVAEVDAEEGGNAEGADSMNVERRREWRARYVFFQVSTILARQTHGKLLHGTVTNSEVDTADLLSTVKLALNTPHAAGLERPLVGGEGIELCEGPLSQLGLGGPLGRDTRLGSRFESFDNKRLDRAQDNKLGSGSEAETSLCAGALLLSQTGTEAKTIKDR